jgi:flavin reductase (DIM6/NTAB) family NADH-FMN oxidoreductase RutF
MPRAPLPPELERFLAKPRIAAVATLREDGSPTTAATWYDQADSRVLLSMDARGPRIRNIRRNPHVALTVLGDEWYSHVSCSAARRRFEKTETTSTSIASPCATSEGPYGRKDHPIVTVLVEVDRWHTFGERGD